MAERAGRIVGIHEYEFRAGVNVSDFEATVREAEERGLFRLPGLIEYRFLRGVKGERNGSYAAIWVFASREEWEALWGSPDKPIGKESYPASWKVWEDELLAPLLDRDPDTITYTDYEQL